MILIVSDSDVQRVGLSNVVVLSEDNSFLLADADESTKYQVLKFCVEGSTTYHKLRSFRGFQGTLFRIVNRTFA